MEGGLLGKEMGKCKVEKLYRKRKQAWRKGIVQAPLRWPSIR